MTSTAPARPLPRSEDESHAKAYFRRAVARSYLGEYELAREDLEATKLLDPSTAADCDRELRRQQEQQRAKAAKAKAQFANFFDRKPEGSS